MAPPAARSEASRRLEFLVSEKDAGIRVDQFLTGRTGFSRSRLARWLKAGLGWVDGEQVAPSYRVRRGERVTLEVPPPEPTSLVPEDFPLDILYEDEDLIVVNKPAGLVTHPAPGHPRGTLLNALLHHCPEMAAAGDLSRPGLVHRLDRDTSGVLVAAKTASAHAHLVRQFQERLVEKIYLAVVWGAFPEPQGLIEREVGRHPTARRKMSVHAPRGKPAHTAWKVLETFPGPLSLLELFPKTGRTHQLRVHLAAVGHPILGDATYGGGASRLKGHPKLQGLQPLVQRQLLHARFLRFLHPRTGAWVAAEAPLPGDFAAVLGFLRSLQGTAQAVSERG